MTRLLFVFVILVICAKLSESASTKFRSMIEHRHCLQKAELKNGMINQGDVRGNYVNFKCDDGLMSNVPNLHAIWFTCKYNREMGRVAWAGDGIELESDKGRTKLYLENVTCLSACFKPDFSAFPDKMKISTKTAKLKIWKDLIIEDTTYYLSGDTLSLECEDGYIHEGIADQEAEHDNVGIHSFYDIASHDLDEVALTKSLQCYMNGEWNNGTVSNYGTCREITCDASSYQNIRNGVIANYKDVFKVPEKMTLECDEGFRPYNNRDNMQCLTDDSFKNQDFKCDAITCFAPAEPLHGRVETNQFYFFLNETAEFTCAYGYTMVGSPVWECQSSGEWDKSCVRCVREDDYCQPPCVPFGARVLDVPRSIDIGTTIAFVCDETTYGFSSSRTCLLNKHWSDGPIDCTGWSLRNPDTGLYLKEALRNTLTKANEMKANEKQTYTIGNVTYGRSINRRVVLGVDAYILLDVSRIIDEDDFEEMKAFVIELVKNLGVSNTTKVAVYFFATDMLSLFPQTDVFENEDFIVDIINSTTLRQSKDVTGQGTDISKALDAVLVDIKTKEFISRCEIAQQVVILISDGNCTHLSDLISIAEELKTNHAVEFFSIAIGTKEDIDTFRVMEHIASRLKGEQHFFALDKTWDMWSTIMINQNPDIFCGNTRSDLTGVKDISQPHYGISKKNAWPWMALLKARDTPVCGGTLISNRWVLTDRLILKQWNTEKINTNSYNPEHDKVMEFEVKYPSEPEMKDQDNVFIHEKYNNPENKRLTYDIALVKLPNSVETSSDLHAVCLWSNEVEKATGVSYASLFKPHQYGIVTGWGFKTKNGERVGKMQQMQFPIQNFTECTRNKHENVTHFDERFMFCAGPPQGETPIIDACKVDNGSPFVVQHPSIEDKYIQIGIVSFDTKNECKENNLDGYYTRLNEELLDWIQATMDEK